MNSFSKFLAIRAAYAKLLPLWMDEYERTGDMRHDPYFMNWNFSPIETHVWNEIRTLGLPFYPQVPVLNYFIDFGCPFLKIGIECDGKAWHNAEEDAVRDERLSEEGWMIFRIEGHECFRLIEPWEIYDKYERANKIEEYFMTTSEGVLSAIRRKYLDQDTSKYEYLIEATLFEHRSTPETHPVKRPFVSAGMNRTSNYIPTLITEIIEGLEEINNEHLQQRKNNARIRST